MKPVKAALALALAASVIACADDDPAALLASAKKYMGKRDFDASVIQLKNVLQKTPQNGEARYLLGLASLEQGDPIAAQIELDKAAALAFASDGLQLALARTALAKGEADKVLERFGGKTLSSPKAQAELTALVGMAQLARSRPGEAQRAFDHALELDASNVAAQVGAARLAASRRDFTHALSRVEQALSGAPSNVEALLLKAELLDAQAKPDQAEKAYRDAIQASPRQTAPRLAFIIHLLHQRAVEKASVEVAAMEKTAPKEPATFYAKALVLSHQKNFAAAREAILHVLKVAPEHVPSLTLAGWAALQTGALPEAESHLRKALFNAPQTVPAKRLLAMTHLRMGRTDLALRELEDLLKLSEDPETIALAGEARLANGDVAGAAREYARAKELAPTNVAVQARLALIRLAAGQSHSAVRELEAASAGDANAYQADLALISNYLRIRDADKALVAIRALEKKQPNNPMTHDLRGAALVLNKDFAGARASFERALQLQPSYMPTVSKLTQLDVREKKPDAAKKRYEAILGKEPNNEQALLGLAALLRLTGSNSQEIEKLLKQSVAANPGSANARAALINFHLRNRDANAALAAAQEAHAALPDQGGLLQLLGATQLAAGETRQAISSFARLGEMLPKAAGPRVLLARAYLVAKEPEEALKVLRAALELRPDLAILQRDIVAVYLATGQPEAALREARAAQAEHPNQPQGHVLEGEVRLAQKKFDLAERKYRETLKQFDVAQIAVRTYAAMEAAGKPAQADALAQDWIKRHPEDAVMLAYLGERDIAAKRYESAAALLQSALEKLPDDPALLNNLAWVANELERPNALEYAERAHELAPENPAIMDTLGMILAGSGQTERGLELLARAAELAPGAHQIRLNFAKTLLKAERKAAARKELEPLVKLDQRLPVQQQAAKLLGGLQ